MTAEDVITRVILAEHAMTVDNQGCRCSCGEIRDESPRQSPEDEWSWYEQHASHVTAHVLDALRANGFAVVELPEPLSDAETRAREWLNEAVRGVAGR